MLCRISRAKKGGKNKSYMAEYWDCDCDWDSNSDDVHSGLCSMAFCRFSTTLSWRIISSILAWASGLNSSAFRASISRIRALRACSCSRALFWKTWAKRWGSSMTAARAGWRRCNCALSAGSPKTWRRISSGSCGRAPPPAPPGGAAGLLRGACSRWPGSTPLPLISRTWRASMSPSLMPSSCSVLVLSATS